MSKNKTLEVKSRSAARTNNIQGRKEEWVPAVVYGPKQASTPVFIPEKFFVLNGTHTDNTIYTLEGDCLQGSKVMFHDIMKNPIGNKVLHADLYAPDMTKPVRVEVEFDFQGSPAGEKEEGGVMQVIRREIEIECPADAIPESISVDVSGLGIGDTLSIADVAVDEKFKVLSAPEWAVVTVSEVKAAPVEEASADEGAAPTEGTTEAKEAAPSGDSDKPAS